MNDFSLNELSLPPSSPILGSRLGKSVAISNQPSIVLGGPDYNEYQGVVRMFAYNNLTMSIDFSDIYGTSGSNFGFDVGIESLGDHIIVGAPELSLDDQGYISLFVNNGDANIYPIANIRGDLSGDYFGYSVAIEKSKNNIYLAGASKKSLNGYVRVYIWDGVGVTQIGSDILENNVSKIRFAKKNWKYLVIGKPKETKVVVYNYNTTSNSWIKMGNDIS